MISGLPGWLQAEIIVLIMTVAAIGVVVLAKAVQPGEPRGQ